jgi:hypothetical protein
MIKRKLPIAITFTMGVVMIIQFFIPHPVSKQFFSLLTTKWLVIIGAFFLLIGLSSLLRMHYFKIAHKREGWAYSLITLAGILFMCIVGFGFGGIRSKPISITYQSVLVPLNATMFSILAFYMASAAFRAFRARTVVATVLLLTAMIVMLGRITLGDFLWEKLPSLTEWIMTVPNMAQKRGILLGVALASLATSLRIIAGIERSYLGSKE